MQEEVVTKITSEYERTKAALDDIYNQSIIDADQILLTGKAVLEEQYTAFRSIQLNNLVGQLPQVKSLLELKAVNLLDRAAELEAIEKEIKDVEGFNEIEFADSAVRQFWSNR